MNIIIPKNNVPSSAKLVFKGQRIGVYQWNQEMFDGSTAIFEGIKYQSHAGTIAVTSHKTILLQREEQPNLGKFINIPGGGIDEGEDILSAVKREMLEESGYVSDNWEFLFSKSSSDRSNSAGYYFIARDIFKIQDNKLDIGEKVEVFEVSFEEFVEIVCTDQFRDKDIKMLVLQAYKNNTLEDLKNQIIGSLC
jgi:ADP-ribose pyrophosphatase